MPRNFRNCVLIIFLALWPSVAQERRIAVSGTVLDPSGTPIAGTEVTLRSADGSPQTAATWYEWAHGRAVLTMDSWRRRLSYVRQDPRVSLTVIAAADWYRHVTLMGEIESIRDDVGLIDYERLARRYGRPPGRLTDRSRVTLSLRVDRWYAWDASLQTPR